MWLNKESVWFMQDHSGRALRMTIIQQSLNQTVSFWKSVTADPHSKRDFSH